jgi:hypothetical protein
MKSFANLGGDQKWKLLRARVVAAVHLREDLSRFAPALATWRMSSQFPVAVSGSE